MKCTMLLLKGCYPEKYPTVSIDAFFKVVGNVRAFVADCHNINVSQIPQRNVERVRTIVDNKNLSPENVKVASEASVSLMQWVIYTLM